MISSNVYILASSTTPSASTGPREVMRKHMTRVYDELMSKYKDIIYIGEDVRHGGYYLVTDGLVNKYNNRIIDLPPDETSLLGITMGMSQSGLAPIVEIPYSKYLDCGLDIFYEICISNWLSNASQPNGMLIRLQGFDRGIFGGNYHTHNMLNFQTPGLDVVCFSNGRDYVRGLRYCMKQVREQKRVIMVVDSTDLLNKRHLNDNNKDEGMLYTYPEINDSEEYNFDQIIVYPSTITTANDNGSNTTNTGKRSKRSNKRPQIVIVSYGNGIPTSLQAQLVLQEQYPNHDVVVIDTPCISQTPKQLYDYMENNTNIEAVVYADVCKYTPTMPLAKLAIDVHNSSVYNNNTKWKVIGAAPTYNPLGSYITFLSIEDITSTVKTMIK
jgi:pyruvate/2-oxoglutarate/acetoin dehydrogenase E1 component